jgi:hypothetical protein
VDLLELKTRMGGILREDLEGFSSSVLAVSAKRGEGLTERTGRCGTSQGGRVVQPVRPASLVIANGLVGQLLQGILRSLECLAPGPIGLQFLEEE